jgi:hypothetical protein
VQATSRRALADSNEEDSSQSEEEEEEEEEEDEEEGLEEADAPPTSILNERYQKVS